MLTGKNPWNTGNFDIRLAHVEHTAEHTVEHTVEHRVEHTVEHTVEEKNVGLNIFS